MSLAGGKECDEHLMFLTTEFGPAPGRHERMMFKTAAKPVEMA